jgi:hypothetical protein
LFQNPVDARPVQIAAICAINLYITKKSALTQWFPPPFAGLSMDLRFLLLRGQRTTPVKIIQFFMKKGITKKRN